MNADRRPALKPVSESVGPIAAMAAVFARDVRVAFRQRQDLLNPLLFFIMVVTLFPPLGVSPEVAFLKQSGAGILWVAALLSVLLSLDHLFRHDFDDGTWSNWYFSPPSLCFCWCWPKQPHTGC